MEFKYGAVQNRSTPTSCHLPTVTYLPGSSLQGGLPGNVSDPGIFQTPVPVNVPVNAEEAMQRELEKQQIRRELEKEEIRREIIASELALARRRELEEEVRREMASERALGIPMHRPEGFSYQPRVSTSFNPRVNNPVNLNHINIFGGPQPQLPSQIDIRQPSTQTNNNKLNKVNTLAKPDADLHGTKRKVMTPSTVDDTTLQKKPKQDWGCALCQVIATSEKGLNDHLQGKKHKAKEASLRTQKIGLDARPESQTLQPCITPTDTGILESREEDQAMQKSQGLGGLENENETSTRKEAGETNALATQKKFKFWCAICHVGTRSEIVMQSHKNGKKHLANMKKFSQNNGVGL